MTEKTRPRLGDVPTILRDRWQPELPRQHATFMREGVKTYCSGRPRFFYWFLHAKSFAWDEKWEKWKADCPKFSRTKMNPPPPGKQVRWNGYTWVDPVITILGEMNRELESLGSVTCTPGNIELARRST